MLQKLKHIVCLTPGFPRDEEDTTRMPAVHQYVLHLHRTQPDLTITVVTLQYPYKQECYDWQGIQVHALATPLSSPVKKMSAWPRVYKKLKQLHQQKTIDLVHSFWLGECAVLGQWFARLKKIPHICTNIGTELLHKNGYLSLLHLSSLNVICQSSFQEKVLTERLKVGSLNVIPFGIKVREQGSPELNERTTDLLFVGNLNPNKNLDQFLEVAGKLVEKRVDLNIRIIGDNIHNLNVNALIEKYRLSGRADYLGRIDNDQVLHEMSRAKILVHPSHFEAGAFVFMEALANGMYIVSRNVGLVKPQPRWQIAETTSEFVAAVEEILNSNMEHSALVPYALDDTVRKHLALYHMLLKKDKSLDT